MRKKNLQSPSMIFHLITTFSILLSLNSYAHWNYPFLEAWDENNDPLSLGPQFNRHFQDFPKSAKAAELPWSDSYWPSFKGGIAYRWYDSRSLLGERTPFTYRTFSQQEVLRMSTQKLSHLSPAEKYDLYVGNYSYPTVEAEKKRTNPGKPLWHGLCHGWAAASINYIDEPKPITVKSPQGISIPFSSSDIKALLIYYQGQVAKVPTKFLGVRCDEDLISNPAGDTARECQDTNAGTFHVVLGNILGKYGTPFIADMTKDKEVWNSPITGYSSIILLRRASASPGAAVGTVQEIDLKTRVTYIVNSDSSWNSQGQVKKEKTYTYRLELNQSGDILGGAWLTSDRPDFLWVQEKPNFEGYYRNLEILYEQSISN